MGGPEVQEVVSGTTMGVYVANLTPYTEYECFVTANTSAGEGEPSRVVFATTDESSKNAPIEILFPEQRLKAFLSVQFSLAPSAHFTTYPDLKVSEYE